VPVRKGRGLFRQARRAFGIFSAASLSGLF
jgi:hypothetical protein